MVRLVGILCVFLLVVATPWVVLAKRAQKRPVSAPGPVENKDGPDAGVSLLEQGSQYSKFAQVITILSAASALAAVDARPNVHNTGVGNFGARESVDTGSVIAGLRGGGAFGDLFSKVSGGLDDMTQSGKPITEEDLKAMGMKQVQELMKKQG